MITYLLAFLKGCLVIEITGAGVERFLNLCRNHNIEFYDVEGGAGHVRAKLKVIRDFYRLYPFARKSGVRLGIVRKEGLPFVWYKNRKRYGYFLGVVLFFSALYFFSTVIWDIEFVGNLKYQDEVLTALLEENGYYAGMKKDAVVCDEVERVIRSSYNDVTWVSAEIRGVRMIISMNENTAMLNPPVADTTPCNLIADVDGTVVSIITRAGTPCVSVGDTVEKDTVLVSGILSVTDDAGEVVSREYVRADADIVMEYTVDYLSYPERTYIVRDYTKANRFYYTQLFGYRFTTEFQPVLQIKNAVGAWLQMGTESESAAAWQEEVYVTEQQLVLFRSFSLPIYWGNIERKYYTERVLYYTNEEQAQVADEALAQYIEDLEKLGVQIIENDVKISLDGNTVMMSGTLLCRHEVTSTEQITPETGQEEE